MQQITGPSPTCPRCHHEAVAGLFNCQHCGASLEAAKRPLPWGKAIGWSLVLGMFAVCSVAVAGTSSDATPRTRSETPSAPRTYTVTYKVEGTAKYASITYSNANGDTSQQADVDVPLTRKADGGQGIRLTGMQEGDFLYISAQNGQEYGSIECAIEIDGIEVQRNVSHGGYTIATCSGRL